MSDFLLNMIQRNQGAVETVQPRIRSIFESETTHPVYQNDFANVTNDVVKNDLDSNKNPLGIAPFPNAFNHAEEHSPKTFSSSHVQQPSHSDVSFRNAVYNSLESNRLDTLNAQIQDVLARFSRKSESTEPSHDDFHEKFEIPQDTFAQSTNTVTPPETKKSVEIEEILSRLQSEISRIAQSKQSPEAGELLASVVIKTGEIEPQPPTQTIRQGSKIDDPFEILDKPAKQPDRIEAAPTNKRQTGALLVPAWLSSLQAELNNRWHEVDARSNPEKVVNVTIGRVEIRATNPSPKPQATVNQKPKGVLSLDDYLKQRESKGQP